MIIEDTEISLTKIFVIVGVIVFISSIIYVSILTAKLMAQRKINQDSYAKEKLMKQKGLISTPAFRVVTPSR